MPRYPLRVRSQRPSATACGSRLSAESPGTAGSAVGCDESVSPSTASRFEAGSVLTSKIRFPRSVRVTAVAQATQVFPTPPFPAKNRKRVARSRNCISIPPHRGSESQIAARCAPSCLHSRVFSRWGWRGDACCSCVRHHGVMTTRHSFPAAPMPTTTTSSHLCRGSKMDTVLRWPTLLTITNPCS